MPLQIITLVIVLIQEALCVPSSKLLSLWPLNEQYGHRDATDAYRHSSILGSVSIQTGNYFYTWPQDSTSYVDIPEIVMPSTDGYFNIFFKMYIDSSGMSGVSQMQLLDFGDTSCSYSVYYRDDGVLALERTVSVKTVTLTKAFNTNTWYNIIITYTKCTIVVRVVDCIVIVQYDGFKITSYALKEVPAESNCPNLYKMMYVGKPLGSSVGLKGSIYCLAIYSGRMEVADNYYSYEEPEYLYNNFCSGNGTLYSEIHHLCSYMCMQ